MTNRSRFAICSLPVFTALAALTGCHTSPQLEEVAELKRGRALLEKKDYPRAILEFRNAAKFMPKDAEPYYQMGLAYLGLSNPQNAYAAFHQAAELNPNHAQAQLKLAELLVSSRNKDLVGEASKRLETVLANAPGDAEANTTLAVAEWQLGHPDDATNRLQEILQKSPADLTAAIALAKMKLASRDVAGAEEALRKMVASDPNSPQAALALAQFYWFSKQPEKAETEVKRALTLDPKNAPALAALAAMQAAGHRMDEAEETYKLLAALPAKEYKHLHAAFLFQNGQRDAALAEFQRLANQDPNDREARGRLVAAYVLMGNNAEAQQLLAAALKKNGKDADALFQRAELYIRDGNAGPAEADLKQVLHFKADSAQAHFALAEVYKLQGAIQNQRHELTESLRLNAGMLPARLALARNLISANDGQAALDVLNQTPVSQRSIVGAVVERNWALYAIGNFKEMRAVLDRALKNTRNPDLLIQDGVLKMYDGDYVGARTDADELLRQNPEDVRAARILADSYIAQKQPQKAVERLSELAHGHPKSAPLQYLLGQYELATGNRTEARQAIEAANVVDPQFLEAGLTLARMDDQDKHPDKARQHIAAVLGADPKNVPALLLLGSIEHDAGNREQAIARYRAVLGIDGKNVFALNNLALELAFDQPDEALQYAQQAGEIAPDNATVEDTLGWIFYRKGVYRTAVDYLKNAVAKEPTPRRQFHLAMSYMKLGEQDLGQKTLATALQKDPNLLKTEHGW